MCRLSRSSTTKAPTSGAFFCLFQGMPCALPLQKKDIMATISINLNVPQGWHELDDAQLRYVYSLIAKEFAADEIKTLALLHFSGCKVIARHDKNSFLLKHGKNLFQTSGTLIAEVIPSLGWLDAIPASPVRLKKLRNHASVDAEFQGVQFETYIVVEGVSKKSIWYILLFFMSLRIRYMSSDQNFRIFPKYSILRVQNLI